jgi:hypothetical protein
MSDYSVTHALLTDIEARQDDLLRQLDELEKKIARVLADYAASFQPAVIEPAVSASSAPVSALPKAA